MEKKFIVPAVSNVPAIICQTVEVLTIKWLLLVEGAIVFGSVTVSVRF